MLDHPMSEVVKTGLTVDDLLVVEAQPGADAVPMLVAEVRRLVADRVAERAEAAKLTVDLANHLDGLLSEIGPDHPDEYRRGQRRGYVDAAKLIRAATAWANRGVQ